MVIMKGVGKLSRKRITCKKPTLKSPLWISAKDDKDQDRLSLDWKKKATEKRQPKLDFWQQ